MIRFLGHLGVRGGETVRGPDGRQIAAAEQYRAEDNPVSEPAPAASTPAPLSGVWTEELAADFMVGLDPVARLMTLHVWRADAASIHRSALCQRTELTPVELGSLVIEDGPRAEEVPAGAGHGAVAAGGGQQPESRAISSIPNSPRWRRPGSVRREDGWTRCPVRLEAPLDDLRRHTAPRKNEPCIGG